MKLDEKGRCCGRKPIDYKGGSWRSPDRPHKFCPRCSRAYDRETGKQIENWAHKKTESDDRLDRELNFRCRHFNGIMSTFCRAGVEYDSLPIKAMHPDFPCHKREKTSCDRYDGYTVEELRQERENVEASIAAITQNVSPCCRAALDMTHVITGGPHNNHGPRFCTKCGKTAFMV